MELTVAELIAELKKEDQTATVIFGSGDLTLLRIKDRTGEVQLEFSELYDITN